MLKFGHRGAAGHAPENTLKSIRKALELGVDGMEIDVHVCKSGELVVIHDETLERTTNGKGFVADHTLAQLKDLDAGQGEKIPTLAEVIELIDKRASLFIELKTEDTTQPVAEMIAHYAARGWSYDQLLPCSFDHPQLKALRVLNSRIKTAAIIAAIPIDYTACAERAGAFAISIGCHHLNQLMVDDAHARNLKCYTWTANQPHHIAKVKKLGVDGIFSDFPERL